MLTQEVHENLHLTEQNLISITAVPFVGQQGRVHGFSSLVILYNLKIKSIHLKNLLSYLGVRVGQDKEVATEKPLCSWAQEVVNTFCDDSRTQKSLKD